jgi:hypothetical protein
MGKSQEELFQQGLRDYAERDRKRQKCPVSSCDRRGPSGVYGCENPACPFPEELRGPGLSF